MNTGQKDQIAANAARAAAVLTGLLEHALDSGLERGETDHRVEQVMVVCVLNWTHEDGSEREDIIIGSETRRRYAQRGILHGAIARLDEYQADDDD